MTNLVGVVRHERDMIKALRNILNIERKAEGVDSQLVDMALVARMVIVSALLRTESRGGHYRSDYPIPVKSWRKRSFITLKEIDTLTFDTLMPNVEMENIA